MLPTYLSKYLCLLALFYIFVGDGIVQDCCLTPHKAVWAAWAGLGRLGRVRSLTHLAWGLRACVCVCVCLCVCENEAGHKKLGTYSREVAETHTHLHTHRRRPRFFPISDTCVRVRACVCVCV